MEKIGIRYSKIASGFIHTSDICAVILARSAVEVEVAEYLTVKPASTKLTHRRGGGFCLSVRISLIRNNIFLPITFQHIDGMDQFSGKLNQFSN